MLEGDVPGWYVNTTAAVIIADPNISRGNTLPGGRFASWRPAAV